MKSIANVNKTVLIPIILTVSFLVGFLFGMNNRQEEHKILPSYDDTVNWEVISFDEAMNHWDDDSAILGNLLNGGYYFDALCVKTVDQMSVMRNWPERNDLLSLRL